MGDPGEWFFEALNSKEHVELLKEASIAKRAASSRTFHAHTSTLIYKTPGNYHSWSVFILGFS
jgi:hypothetical protein